MRLGQTLLALLGVSTILFFVIRLTGDPAVLIAGDAARPEVIERIRRELGLDAPLHVQYVRFLVRLLLADFGNSLWYPQSALKLVALRLPETLRLLLAAMLISVAVGVPLGIVAAVRRGSVWGWLSTLVALLGQSVPSFLLGVLLVLLFALTWSWFPPPLVRDHWLTWCCRPSPWPPCPSRASCV